MAFDPNKLDSTNTPMRWRIVGEDVTTRVGDDEEKAKLDSHYLEVLEQSATFTSGEELGVGNQPGVGSEPEPNPVLVSGVTITGAIDELDLNGTTTVDLGVTVRPSDADDLTVTWASSDDSVATVDSDGVVTAVAEGVVEISVTANDANGATDNVEITVVDTTP